MEQSVLNSSGTLIVTGNQPATQCSPYSDINWKRIHLCLATGAIYGLLWAVVVLALGALRAQADVSSAVLHELLIHRVAIGSKLGVLAGTLLGLIAALYHCQLDIDRIPWRHTVSILVSAGLWAGLIFALFITVEPSIVPIVANVDGPSLPSLGLWKLPILVIALALPPLAVLVH